MMGPICLNSSRKKMGATRPLMKSSCLPFYPLPIFISCSQKNPLSTLCLVFSSIVLNHMLLLLVLDFLVWDKICGFLIWQMKTVLPVLSLPCTFPPHLVLPSYS